MFALLVKVYIFTIEFNNISWQAAILGSWKGTGVRQSILFCTTETTLQLYIFFAQKRTYFTINNSELVILNYFLERTSFVY